MKDIPNSLWLLVDGGKVLDAFVDETAIRAVAGPAQQIVYMSFHGWAEDRTIPKRGFLDTLFNR